MNKKLSLNPQEVQKKALLQANIGKYYILYIIFLL